MKTGRSVFAAFVVTASLVALAPASAAQPADPFHLTVLYFGNSGGSMLPVEGGFDAASFVGEARTQYRRADRDGAVVLIGTGDYLAPGPELAAGIADPDGFAPAAVLSRLPVDAYALGDRDFGAGPDVFAEFVTSFNRRPTVGPVISANVSAGTDPALVPLTDAGRLATSTVAVTDERRVAIVAVTDPTIVQTAGTGAATVDVDVIGSAQREIDNHLADGVDAVVLVSHLATDDTSRVLVAGLRGVDVVLSGAEANPARTADLYLDADQRIVVYSAAAGGFAQVGKLGLTFDGAGSIVGVTDTVAAPVTEDSRVDLWSKRLVDQLRADLVAFKTDPLARSQVDLNAVRSDLRSGVTNFGNLVADATLWQSRDAAERLDRPVPDIALIASELFTSDTVIDNQALTMAQTFDALGDAGSVATVASVSRDELRIVLEDAVKHMDDVDGRFPQFAGFTLDLDLVAPAREATLLGVVEPGARVVNLRLNDGTWIVQDSAVVPGDPLTIATVDRLIAGADRYQFSTLEPQPTGGTLQQAVVAYIEGPLERAISVNRYPAQGNDRLYLF